MDDASGPDSVWQCPKCGEIVEPPLEMCWNCGTDQAGHEDPDFLAPLPDSARPFIPPPPAPPRPRRPFQFTIRAILLLFLVAALPLGWIASILQHARHERAAVARIEELGGWVITHPDADPPEWLRGLFGQDQFVKVVEVSIVAEKQVSDDDLGCLQGLTRLKSLNLTGTPIGDAGLRHLEQLDELEVLLLSDTRVRGPGLAHLAGLRKLFLLCVDDTPVDDAAIDHLNGLCGLGYLDIANTDVTDVGLRRLNPPIPFAVLILRGTRITNAGLEPLAKLTKLGYLDLGETQITDEGLKHIERLGSLKRLSLPRAVSQEAVERLQQKLPGCEVDYDAHL